MSKSKNNPFSLATSYFLLIKRGEDQKEAIAKVAVKLPKNKKQARYLLQRNIDLMKEYDYPVEMIDAFWSLYYSTYPPANKDIFKRVLFTVKQERIVTYAQRVQKMRHLLSQLMALTDEERTVLFELYELRMKERSRE